MKPAMYLFINKGLRMSPGKIAAQAGHAAVEAYRLSDFNATRFSTLNERQPDPASAEKAEAHELLAAWYIGGHYAKYIMEARDSEHIRDIQTYLEARGFRTVLILDEGHTEVAPIVPTALGAALVDKDDEHTAATFSSFKLYREPRPPMVDASESPWTDPGPPPPGPPKPKPNPDAGRWWSGGGDYTVKGDRGVFINTAGPFLRAMKR